MNLYPEGVDIIIFRSKLRARFLLVCMLIIFCKGGIDTFFCAEFQDMAKPQWAFRGLVRAHRHAHGAVFERVGIRDIGQPLLLKILLSRHESGAQITQGELAKIMNISASTLTISVKSLEKNGYIHKSQDETDMRRNFLQITEKGIAAARECSKCFEEIDKAMYFDFSEEEREAAHRLLTRMTKNLQKFVDGCNKSAEREV